MRGGDWEGGGPIGAKGEKHQMWESVQGQSSAWIPTGEDSMIGGVAVQRRRLKRGWKPGGCRVDLRRGAYSPRAGPAVLVFKEEI